MTDLAEKLAGLSKLQDGINRPHWERHQEKVGKILFDWWWATAEQPSPCCLWDKYIGVESNLSPLPQTWEDLPDRTQAHWMEGARRVMGG